MQAILFETLPPGFSVIHANRMEDLRRLAVEWMYRHPLKPLENEIIIVQSNGMAQWLKLALAANDGCGISAALKFQLPGRFLWQIYRAVLGADRIPLESPYDKLRLHWRLMRLLPTLVHQDGFAPLARFLADDSTLRKRFQLAGQLADLYDQYQVYRADWLEDWARQEDCLRRATGPAQPLPASQRWQAELWRRLQADIPETQRAASRSEVHRRFIEALAVRRSAPAGLPRRVLVFGISALPQQALQALQALSVYSQVLVFVHNPCRYYWADIVEDRELLQQTRTRHARKGGIPANLHPELLHQHVNPLLAAWGRQGRDYIGLLVACEQDGGGADRAGSIDLFTDAIPPDQRGSLLQQVQQAILELEPLPLARAPNADDSNLTLASAPGPLPVAVADQSIFFQSAHSPQREVEILQDHLLTCFAAMPHLTPRDVIVMMPDIDAYAPHIDAVFGHLKPEAARYIPFSVADRSGRSASPLLPALEKLLQLPEARVSVADVMDLLDVAALRQRFGLVQDDLPRLHQWIQGAGIRWGLSAGHRQRFDLPPNLTHNTWRAGLQRMLLGYASGAGAPWQGIEPYDEIGGLEAVLAGPLATLLETLEKYALALEQAAPVAVWCQRLVRLFDDCFLPDSPDDLLFRQRLDETLMAWRTACEEAALDDHLTLPVVRETLLGALQTAGVSQRFLVGKVNFCTLMPMRAIPFRIVCLLGMHDGAYPRSHAPLDFDLMRAAGNRRAGDRARREDDRYLFLEALLSARDQLYISYTGRSIRDNSVRTPSVLVAQLQDYLAAGWYAAPDSVAPDSIAPDSIAPDSIAPAPVPHLLERISCQHPLQPFSRRYFEAPAHPNLFTWSREWREMLDAPVLQTEAGGLPATAFEGSLQLMHLIRFLRNPAQYFFNTRLNIYFDESETDDTDREPFHLDALAPFQLGPELLEAALAVAPSEHNEAIAQAAARLRRNDTLPPGSLGELAAKTLATPVRAMLEHYQHLLQQWPVTARVIEVQWPIPIEGCGAGMLEDWLSGLQHSAAEPPTSPCCARWEFEFGNVFGKTKRLHTLLPLWVRHLAGCSQRLSLTSYLIAPDGVVPLSPLAPDVAATALTKLIEHWWQALHQPLPVTARTALPWLESLAKNNDEAKARSAACQAFEGNGPFHKGERDRSPYLARLWPDFAGFWEAENNRFKYLAKELYRPLLQALEST